MKLPKIKIKVSISKGEQYTITSSDDVANVCRSIFSADTISWTEEMLVICLNRANVVIGYHKVSSGGFAGTVCDPKVIMTIALQTAASSIILTHNHPSGNLKPSEQDVKVTRKIHDACALLDLKLLDHVIITADNHYSMLENGNI
jgi:DNA repair protein RadC